MLRTGFYFFLLLSFIEGASVMGAELLGAKMLAPFFGSSLYVWASVMAITLGGLAGGYFAGGILSTRPMSEKNLYVILLLAASFTILMPFTTRLAFLFFGQMDLIPAVIISSFLILFPPVFLMGMVSPLIICNITTDNLQAGKASGTVYAISTVGGILATLFFGFLIIPEYGLTVPSYFTGIILGILPLIQLLRKKKAHKPVAFFILFIVFGYYWLPRERQIPYLDIVYSSEGLLGQIMVIDFPTDIYTGDTTRKGEKSRWLYVNRVSQTKDDASAKPELGEERYFTYVYHLEQAMDTFPEGRKKILLLGLGGGSVAKHFSEKGFEVDACELDRRIAFVAKNYFELPDEVNVVIDDARHYLEKCRDKYDIIIFDTFKGEEAPSHVFTVESLTKVKSLLKPQGLVFVNGFGFVEGKKGLGLRSIYRTFTASGYQTGMWPTSGDVARRNVLFVSSLERQPYHEAFIDTSRYDFSDGVVMKDEYPRFEILNAPAALAWRKASIKNFYEDRLQKVIPVFK